MLAMFPSADGGEEILQSLIKMANSVVLKKVCGRLLRKGGTNS